MKLIRIELAFRSLITVDFSTHYRGSIVTWRVVNATTNPLVIEVL
jgi:hypothetical protein